MAFKFSLRNLGQQPRPKHAAANFVPTPVQDAVYRGYGLETKSLMVGWQVTIVKNEAVVWHTGIAGTADAAASDARAYIDRLLLENVTPAA